VIDPMTYVAKGAGASLSKIGDIAKSIKGIGKVDLPTMPDGSLHLPDGQLPQTGGHLPAANGIPTSPSVPHQTVPGTGLPQSWTIDQPAAAASHTGNGFPGVTHANDTYPMGGHNNTPVNAAGHTPAGSYGPPPSGSYGPPPSGSFGPPPSGSYGPPSGGDFGPHGGSFGPTGGSFDQVPGNAGNHVPTPHIDPAGHVPTGAVPDHAPTGGQHVPTGGQHVPTGGQHVPTGGQHVPGAAGHPGTPNAWYHQTPTNSVTHDVPTTPHPGGHDVPGTGGHGTPDAPHHGPGHDGPGAHDGHGGHGHDGAHGGGHADDAAHAGDDAAHAGDHPDFGDGGAHHGADTPTAPGHGGTDVPGSGAGEPFEYKPHMSDAEFAKLSAAEKHRVALAELSDGTVDFPSDISAEKYGQGHWNDYAENMPQSQKDAVFDYTKEPPQPTPTYKEINGYLRGNSDFDTPQVRHEVEEIDKALAGRTMPEDIMVVRGTGLGHIDVPSPVRMAGNTYPDHGYMSTSLGNHPVPSFAGKEAILRLRVPKGTPSMWVEKVSAFGKGERELLLGRGTEYKVSRVFMDDSGRWQIYGEVLPRT
ncbi:ADP-ribosyltransferase, partial [Streptomyces sp. NPDC047117]|uniref:ADP-ribosyltransferase n=1 Tax=Streptomyces sp. NPDC047117 TaxID=3155379 RepID=UPI0033DC4372